VHLSYFSRKKASAAHQARAGKNFAGKKYMAFEAFCCFRSEMLFILLTMALVKSSVKDLF